MPVLQPRIQPHDKPPTIVHKPMYRLLHREDVTSSFTISDRWGDSEDGPPTEISNYVDIIHNQQSGGCVLDHYVLHRIDIPGSPLPKAFPVHVHEVQMPNFEMGEDVASTWITPGDTLMLFKTNTHLMARLCALPLTKGESYIQYPECKMWLAGEDLEYGFAHCSFSGRVCIRDEIRPCEIRVIDYLP